MVTDSNEIERLLSILTQTPSRISTATTGLYNTRLTTRPTDVDWSANEILAHLRSCADVWGKSILAMIKQDHPTLRYISPRTWIRKTNYLSLEFHTSLDSFAKQRIDLLQSLRALAMDEWSRGATFTGTTKRREQTIEDYVRRMVEHEVEHCAQLEVMLRLL
jgi:uncharacterized damage-inducible protein DinB